MEEIAVVYARSLFEAALDTDDLDVVREQLGEFTDVVAADQQLQVFFFSPYFSTQEKKEGLRKAVDGAEPIFLNFIELLLENHRMPELFRIRREYDTLWERHNRRLPVSVTSAVELDEQTVSRIGDRIAEQTGADDRAVRARRARHPRRHRRPRRQHRCSTPPSATASRPFASRSSGPSRATSKEPTKATHADQA